MIKNKNQLFLPFFLLLACAVAGAAEPTQPIPADSKAYFSLNLNHFSKENYLEVPISRDFLLENRGRSGEGISFRLYVQDEKHQKRYVRDIWGQRAWRPSLHSDGTGSLKIVPALSNYSGQLFIEGGHSSSPLEMVMEKVYEQSTTDGALIKVHFSDQILEETKASVLFPKQVLIAASAAYEIITKVQGFNTPGFSFSNPNREYAYDPDQAIDIYLGNPNPDNNNLFHGFSSQSYRESPCFDTLKKSEKAYQAIILLPANYREFIQEWEKLNASPLGVRNIGMDLNGTLIHEMLHVVLFFYNKNLNHESCPRVSAKNGASKAKLDWYVEGLARYFETFAGARHDFFAQGFRETLKDKIRFSRGGSNYFMRYPDQPFTELRYENALFWRFIDYQYGIKAIEELSQEFRASSAPHFQEIIEKVTGKSMAELLKNFSLASLLNDFGLKQDAVYLKEVAKTRVYFRDQTFYLVDGYGKQQRQGSTLNTDWVGQWDQSRAFLGEMSVAGDNTSVSDVSAWASDFYEISIAAEERALPTLQIQCQTEGKGLAVQLVISTLAGSRILREWGENSQDAPKKIHLQKIVAEEKLDRKALDKINLIITNLDSQKSANYEIISSI